MTEVIKVAAVDDHPIVLDGIAGWVSAGRGGADQASGGTADSGPDGIEVVGTAATVAELLAGPAGRRGRGAAGP